MRLVSVNTGVPRKVTWHGRIVTTAIFKEPAKGRVILRKLNLEGDRQADLTVHGESTRPFTATRWYITTTGRKSCPGASC
jgi:MOSC domain-containing protein YiiM